MTTTGNLIYIGNYPILDTTDGVTGGTFQIENANALFPGNDPANSLTLSASDMYNVTVTQTQGALNAVSSDDTGLGQSTFTYQLNGAAGPTSSGLDSMSAYQGSVVTAGGATVGKAFTVLQMENGDAFVEVTDNPSTNSDDEIVSMSIDSFVAADMNALSQQFSSVTEVVCFTPNGIIETFQGAKPIRDLVIGDKVLTRDNGYQELRWIYSRHLNQQNLCSKPELAPVTVKKDSFGPNVPERDLTISPGHMVLVSGDIPNRMFGEPEILIPAKRLEKIDGVFRNRPKLLAKGTTYVHLVFDAHEVVRVDGMWSESFRPSPASLKMIHRDGYQELKSIFPDLTYRNANTLFPEARPSIYAGKAKRIAHKMASKQSLWGN